MKRKFVLFGTLILGLCLLVPQQASAQDKSALVMSFLNTGYTVDVTAGRDNHYSLELRNIGQDTLNDIRLTSDLMSGWIITFSPARVSELGPGNVQFVDVNFHPPTSPQPGNQYFRIIATAGSYQTIQGYQLHIKSAPVLLWVLIGISVVVVAVFAFIFLRSRSKD
jgi:uncharacterized membrane protein